MAKTESLPSWATRYCKISLAVIVCGMFVTRTEGLSATTSIVREERVLVAFKRF